MKKIIISFLCLAFFVGVVSYSDSIYANDFASAYRVKLNTSFSLYGNDNYYYTKIRVKKRGKYTVSINTKCESTYVDFMTKNGNFKRVDVVDMKQKQGEVCDLGAGGFGFYNSYITNRCKCSLKVRLKKGTYVIRYRSDGNSKIKVKTKFKR